LSWLYLF